MGTVSNLVRIRVTPAPVDKVHIRARRQAGWCRQRGQSVEGIQEPVVKPMATVLRRAVLDHVRSETRREYPALLHVGVPGRCEEVFSASPDEPLDHSLRTDVVAAMLHATRRIETAPMLWLTRPGRLELQDVDAQWLAAARAASGEAGAPLTLVVVTRKGWWDPRSDVRREWKRLRIR
jgi:hypothetical protein